MTGAGRGCCLAPAEAFPGCHQGRDEEAEHGRPDRRPDNGAGLAVMVPAQGARRQEGQGAMTKKRDTEERMGGVVCQTRQAIPRRGLLQKGNSEPPCCPWK